MAEINEIIWVNSAKEDLKRIYDFLTNSINEKIAFEIITKLIYKVEILYSQPLIGQKEPKFEKLEKEYRRLIEKDYKIVYHISEDKAYINRVFDARQNPMKLKIK